MKLVNVAVVRANDFLSVRLLNRDREHAMFSRLVFHPVSAFLVLAFVSVRGDIRSTRVSIIWTLYLVTTVRITAVSSG